MLRRAAGGFVLGAAWGLAARVWMRLISTDPGFSWSGTMLIVTAAAVGGLGLGLVSGARAAGRSWWWRTAALLAFPIVAAPQGILVFTPAFLLGGLALSGRLRWWARTPLLAVVAACPVALMLSVPAEERQSGVPVVFLGGLLVLAVGMAFAGSHLLRRWDVPPRVDPPAGWQDAPDDVRHAAGSGASDIAGRARVR